MRGWITGVGGDHAETGRKELEKIRPHEMPSAPPQVSPNRPSR
jgi:hypothetical protein